MTAVALEDDAMALLATREADVLQIVREALSNVARHSAARTCRVTASTSETLVVLSSDDDGRGFDVHRARLGSGGVANIEARARSIGATVALSSDETGSTVTLELPR